MTNIKMHVDEDKRSETSDSEWHSSDSDVLHSEDGSNDEETELQDDASEGKNVGLADVMSKILSKNLPKHQKTILVKSKTEREIQKLRKERGKGAGADDDYKDVFAKIEKRKLWEHLGRVKPKPLERERERYLQRIATRGVVQLFNAVRKQQKIIGDKLVEAGSSVRKQDKVMESMTKGKFLDLLKGTKSNATSTKVKEEEIKEEPVGTEEGEKWSILRDNFMMGAKMKDWDKEDSGDEGGAEEDMSDNNDMSDSE